MPNILPFFTALVKYINGLIGNLDSITFAVGSVDVSLWDLFLGFIVMCLVFSVFWKGART